MKTLNFLFIVFVLTFFSCQNPDNPDMADLVEAKESKILKEGVFFHVSSGYDNPQKALMALSLAVKMAEWKNVTLFFDLEGVKLLTKNSEDIQMDNFMTAHEALKILLEQKVQIMACPMCTKAAGINSEDYLDGIILAEKEKFFNFTKGRILTLDY